MKHFITSIYAHLNRFEQIEYSLMLLLTITLPIDWHIGLWSFILLVISTVVKSVATHHIGNPSLQHPHRICLYLMMLLYLIYGISTIYSANPAEAWSSTMITMLPMLLLPTIFLVSDLSYLTRQHRSLLVFFLSTTLTVRFVVLAIRAGISAVQGTPMEELIDAHFDPLHHNYLALYLISAIALMYPILVRHWKDAAWAKWRWMVIADMIVLTLYVVVSGSRSGLLIEAALFVACMIHLTFSKRQWKATLLLAATVVVFVGATYMVAPKLYWRIVYLAEQMAAGNQGDSRQTLWACGVEVLQGHEVIGLGCDGYWQQLHQCYVDHNFAEGIIHEELNTHNQFLETALATGVIGLMVLLAVIVIPLVRSLCKPKNLPMLQFTIVYVGSLCFEVSLVRQMGLLFICWWYCLLINGDDRSL